MNGAAIVTEKPCIPLTSGRPRWRSALWHAFRILPDRIEFWPSGWQRLRERVRYRKDADGQWSLEAVNP